MMAGNLQDRPFLLLILRVMRPMLALCAAACALVGGALWYSITTVQGRGMDTLTAAETVGLGLLIIVVVVCAALYIAAGRMVRQNQDR
jgi:hypothetical protein